MKPGGSIVAEDENDEIATLIATLHATEQKLEKLTAGQVDTVTSRQGHTLLLRNAQDRLRDYEAAKQIAILNALPAHIALLDSKGIIVSVNDAWRQFESGHVLQGFGYAPGQDYLQICRNATGSDALQAQAVAKGITCVLNGSAKEFSFEYPSHTSTQFRWFLLSVTPFSQGSSRGAVVMHLEITDHRLAKEELRESERRFSEMLGTVELVSLMLDREGRITYCNDYLLKLTGWDRQEVIGRNWFEMFIPSHLQKAVRRIFVNFLESQDPPERHGDGEIVTRSGECRLIRWNNSVLRSIAEDVIGTASIGEDITERSSSEQRLLQSEAQYRNLIEQAADGIFVADKDGCFLLANSRGCELLGYSEAELLGMNGNLTYVDEDRDLHAQRMRSATAGETLRFERMVKRKDGSVFPAEVSLKSLDGNLVQIITHDITARHAQDQKFLGLNRIHEVLSGINAAIVRIRDRRELFREACRIIVEHGRFALGWIAVLDRQTGTLTAVAQAGLRANSAAGNALFDGSTALMPGGTAEIALREGRTAVDNAIENQPGPPPDNEPDTLKVRRAAIELGAKAVIVLPLFVEKETFGILTLYASERDFFDEEEIRLLNDLAGDISFGLEFIAKEEKADFLVYYDALTGLANRGLFLERVGQYIGSAINAQQHLAVVLIDLERFRNINDSLGTTAGDALLIQVADWLKHSVGDAHLLARVGSDHFALVLPELNRESDVAQILEKTIGSFSDNPFHLHDAVFRLGVKVGVAVFPADGTTADILFNNAEAALKKAKRSGDRYLFYTSQMTEAVASKLALENQLRRALDLGEFELHYQPKVTLEGRRLTGAEALIRWNDPQTGLVAPARFIPVLEETGLIYEVGRWALRQAIGDHLRWRTMGLAPVRIAVNVSPLQLRNRGFVADVKQAIGVDPQATGGLELEITESLIMEDIRNSFVSLQTLRDIGIIIAIDDFGTGFSSLSYLAKLPVDTLKIDRSFVVDMTASQSGLALVSTIIGLAHSLKLKVVAEGVETDEQARLLRLLNCDEMQGFLFSRPIPREVFETKFLLPLAPH
ncbi:MAG: EAL domain-containing protein [Betaproteobacteria bacterium]